MTNIVVKKPSKCTKSELDLFEALVRKGHEVSGEGLRDRIKKAKWLVFLFESDKTLAGVAALKEPNVSYKKKVFKKPDQRKTRQVTYEREYDIFREAVRGRKFYQPLLKQC